MISIEFEHNLQKKILAFLGLQKVMFEARRTALSAYGFYLMGRMRDHIESFSKSEHPLAALYMKKYGSNFSFSKRGFTSKARPVYHFLGKFSRYKISPRADKVDMGFGKSKKGAKNHRFDSKLQEIAGYVDKGRKVPVSEKMRRKIAYSTGGRVAIKKSTTQFDIEERPIEKPVTQQHKNRATEIFKEKYVTTLEKGFNKL